MKKFLSIILTVAMLCSFAACEGEIAPAAKEKPYVACNNLEVESVDYSYTEDGYVDKQYFKINGLKDEKIQSSINEEIENTFISLDSWTETPSYRGIALKLKKFDGKDPDSTWTNAYVHSNVGNVLSVSVEASKQYSSQPRDGYYEYLTVSDTKTFNYDLNTGNKLLITDIFKDGVDGLAYINDKINDMILNTNADEEQYSYADGWNTFKVVGAFEGIKADQKFYLTNDGNAVILVLDYDTPWAFTDSSPITFNVDISEVSAISSKYVKDGIYTNETQNYIFPYYSNEEKVIVDSEISDYEYKGILGCYYDEHISHYEDSLDSQVKPILEFAAECTKMAEEFIETVAKPHKDENGLYCWVTINCSPQRIGNYTVYRCNCYMDANIYNEFDYVSLGSNHLYKVFNYKDGVEEALELKDLFVPGYDLSTIGENLEDYSFQIGNDCIFLEKENDYISLEYKDIGCDNLTLFN
ncbi:MAG: DUF3298 domain-containing protein [Bacillota bacterium]|nr:DUF3298 domain-containing protein [Bacillota bacterium]